MDAHAIWIVIVSIATSVGAIVGFGIQLRNVKKSRLENEKLQLDIAALKASATSSARRIAPATTEEVMKIAFRGACPGPEVFEDRGDLGLILEKAPRSSRDAVMNAALMGTLLALALLFVGYLTYDLYRLFLLISGWF